MNLNEDIRKAFQIAFEGRCHSLLADAYKLCVAEKKIRPDWHENDITSELHRHISSSPMRKDWCISSNVEHHLHNSAVPELPGFSAKFPRIDLRMTTFGTGGEYEYFVEAKNLKEGDSRLKRRYISTGIDNFMNKKYYQGCLAGYQLEGSVLSTISGINSLLIRDGRGQEVLEKITSKYFSYSFRSTHENVEGLIHNILDFN